MTTRMICGKWPLELGEHSTGPEKKPEGYMGGQFSWVNDKKVRYNADAFLDVLNQANLPTGMTALEFCGGIGEFTVVIQNVLKPSHHRVFDYDQECADHLKRTFPQCEVAQGDARETMKKYTADFVSFDPPKMRAEDHHLWPMAEMYAFKPRYALLCDTSRPRVALHRATHTKFLDFPVRTYDDYVQGYDKFLRRKYGYKITAVGRRWYCWLLTEPE